MAFVLVGYPAVAPNYFQNDPLHHPPHPVLAQVLRSVAESGLHAQVATFMASATDIGELEYFNYTFMNGDVEADILEAAEFQAASIMAAAAQEGSFEPYMSFGYRDYSEAPPIEKLDSYDDYVQNDYVSDVDKAVQQQVDQHEAVCSSSSYPFPVEDVRNLEYDPPSTDRYSSADMSKPKYADDIASTVTQQQPIRDGCISAAAIPECTNDGPCCNNSDNGATSLQDQFPELPKRDIHVRKSTNPYAPSRLPIDYAAIVKRNVIQPPQPTMPAYANLCSRDQLLQTAKQAPLDELLCQEAAFDNVSPPQQSPTTLCPQEHASEPTMTNGSQDDSVAEQPSDDARSAAQQQSKLNNMPNYADIVKRSPKYADITKRKACSPPEYAPSKKIMKQESSLTVRARKAQEPVTNDAAIVTLQSQLIRDQEPKTGIAAPHPLPPITSKLPEPLGRHDDLAPPDDAKPPNITPYAEVVRRSTSKNHSACGDSAGGGTKRGAQFKPKLLASLDRLEQLLVRPARIPWVETGDPLMELYQKERKLANDYGYKMNEYFKLSQKYYHARDWVNAKLYSNEGHRYRKRMHKLHTQASRRIFEQRNQQDALFIDLHGMHVDEARANIDQWFQELRDYRGIVYIVTGTGHHSRTGNRKESKLRPAVHTYLCNMYRCEETSVLGDDKGGVFAVYLCPHRFNPAIPHCVYCKFRPTK